MKYKVEYTIKNYEEVFYSPSYHSYEEALQNKFDIAGYEGIENVSIIEVEENEK
jgi:hypothetical protein